MSQDANSQPSDSEQTIFDRLADGELSASERKSLLARLDDTPGGWRQCALALLEAQALRKQLGAFAAESLRETTSSQIEPVANANRSNRSAGLWFAVAASVLLAFGLGTLVGPAGDAPQNQMAVANLEGSQVAPPQLAETLTNKQDETLTLWVSDGQGGRRSLEAPLVDADTVKREFGEEVFVGQLAESPSRVSPRLRRNLEGRGFRLNTRRRFAPLFLEGGQPLVVPVEDVQIVPVGGTEL